MHRFAREDLLGTSVCDRSVGQVIYSVEMIDRDIRFRYRGQAEADAWPLCWVSATPFTPPQKTRNEALDDCFCCTFSLLLLQFFSCSALTLVVLLAFFSPSSFLFLSGLSRSFSSLSNLRWPKSIWLWIALIDWVVVTAHCLVSLFLFYLLLFTCSAAVLVVTRTCSD